MKLAVTSVLLLLILFTTDAQAYLDPGTGSMLLQVVLGGLAAIGVILKLYWHKFINLFRKSETVGSEDQ
jgi:hypothetical protein